MTQTTTNILMISPVAFSYNKQTAKNNYYQKKPKKEDQENIQKNAELEFNNFFHLLRENNINVIRIKDTLNPNTPDSIFPNNWISFHKNGSVCLYPLFAENRRLERRNDILHTLENEYNFEIKKIIDFTKFEKQNLILEGTGSLVLDRSNKIAYAAISERTSKLMIKEFCEKFKYKECLFSAFQTINKTRLPVYHTNVVLHIGEKIAIICLNSIDNQSEKIKLINSIESTKKTILDISEDQCNSFAGNMLEVKNTKGDNFTIMSRSAYKSLSKKQISLITSHTKILHSPLDTIESCGGGSARCMLAEIFLKHKS